MTYDVTLTILGGPGAGAPVYHTNVILQLSDVAYQTLSTYATPSIDPTAPAPAAPWVVTIAGNLLEAIAAGKLDIPSIKPEIFKFLELTALVEPGKIGISVVPTLAASMSEAVTLTASPTTAS